MVRRRHARGQETAGCFLMQRFELYAIACAMRPPGGSCGQRAQACSVWVALAALAVVGATACDSRPENQGPEEVVREFLARMAQVHGNPADAKLAYELMW